MMIDALKKQCFLSMRSEDVSDAQLATFISIANTANLNPLEPGMLYAYPSKNGGIIPITGPDGVLKKLDEKIMEGKLDGFECVVFPEDPTLPPTYAVAKIFRKGSDHPSVYTAIFREWCVSSNPNWSARPRHMLWMRAIKQCARQVIHGLPMDEDDVTIGAMVNVTPATDTAPAADAPKKEAPARKPKGAATVVSEVAPSTPPVAKDSKIVEGNFTEAPAAPQAEASPVAKPVEKVAEAVAPAESTDIPASDEKKRRTSLEENETISAEITVVEVIAAVMGKQEGKLLPVVQASVKGDFLGIIAHFGGATQTGTKPDGTPIVVANPEWTAGNRLSISLFGKKGAVTAANPKPKIIPLVKSLTVLGAQSETAVDVG